MIELVSNKLLNIFILSMLPVSELRGAILYALLHNIDLCLATIISIIGNLVIIPILLFLTLPTIKLLKKIKFLEKIIELYEIKASIKLKKYEKFIFWGLILFVGIPLPSTGVYTAILGSLILGVSIKKTALALTLGVLISGTIMYLFANLIQFGVLNL